MYFNQNNQAIKRLILLNLAIFAFEIAIWVFSFLMNLEYSKSQPFVSNPLLEYFFLPSDISLLLVRPWTVVTHMFFHAGFGHLFFNMITLYFIGRITADFFSDRKIYQLYFLGGLFGAIITLASFQIFPVFADLGVVPMMGASAAVLSIIMATVALLPNYEVNLFGLFRMKLMWLGLIIVGLDVINIPRGNSGGHIAHLGGALFGYLYVIGMQKGLRYSSFGKWWNRLFAKRPKIVYDERNYQRKTRKPKEKTYHQQKQEGKAHQNKTSKPRQDEVDAILDKISHSGYQSLNSEEKDILFRASK
jgi:membrane associated rhomboid family serine protease